MPVMTWPNGTMDGAKRDAGAKRGGLARRIAPTPRAAPAGDRGPGQASRGVRATPARMDATSVRSIGLTRWWWKPASRVRARSCSWP
ncbi:hypothetical protein OJF2_40040 [Aquisphaera giovannonii]|uniref:Uncharacterized protein n=1 Tax=Aquisphaera giovannonii TaxID=406548 RepID=A0A5B9W4C6_9BACT|nr:hypothetical protein OJF2_40040 [Aquisphaera giovannonii]